MLMMYLLFSKLFIFINLESVWHSLPVCRMSICQTQYNQNCLLLLLQFWTGLSELSCQQEMKICLRKKTCRNTSDHYLPPQSACISKLVYICMCLYHLFIYLLISSGRYAQLLYHGAPSFGLACLCHQPSLCVTMET